MSNTLLENLMLQYISKKGPKEKVYNAAYFVLLLLHTPEQ